MAWFELPLKLGRWPRKKKKKKKGKNHKADSPNGVQACVVPTLRTESRHFFVSTLRTESRHIFADSPNRVQANFELSLWKGPSVRKKKRKKSTPRRVHTLQWNSNQPKNPLKVFFCGIFQKLLCTSGNEILWKQIFRFPLQFPFLLGQKGNCPVR